MGGEKTKKLTIACKSASMSSSCSAMSLRMITQRRWVTHVEVDLIEVAVGLEDDIHVVETCNLVRGQSST